MSSRRRRRTNKKSTKKKREQFGSPLLCKSQFFAEPPLSSTPGLRKSLFRGLLGKDAVFGKEKKSKIQQIADNIKEAESLINDICQSEPNPIQVEENSKKIRKLMSKALKLSIPLAKTKRREDKIQEKINELKNNPDYKFSVKGKKFVKKIKKKPQKKNKTKSRKRKMRSKRK